MTVLSIICAETCQIVVNCITKKNHQTFSSGDWAPNSNTSHLDMRSQQEPSALKQHCSRGSSAYEWCYNVHVGGETPGCSPVLEYLTQSQEGLMDL